METQEQKKMRRYSTIIDLYGNGSLQIKAIYEGALKHLSSLTANDEKAVLRNIAARREMNVCPISILRELANKGGTNNFGAEGNTVSRGVVMQELCITATIVHVRLIANAKFRAESKPNERQAIDDFILNPTMDIVGFLLANYDQQEMPGQGGAGGSGTGQGGAGGSGTGQGGAGWSGTGLGGAGWSGAGPSRAGWGGAGWGGAGQGFL